MLTQSVQAHPLTSQEESVGISHWEVLVQIPVVLGLCLFLLHACISQLAEIKKLGLVRELVLSRIAINTNVRKKNWIRDRGGQENSPIEQPAHFLCQHPIRGHEREFLRQ